MINSIFFVTNQQNYAIWLALYYNNLMNVDSTHPGLEENHFNQGSFSSRRTAYAFSREPIDEILEETINADAGSYWGINYMKQNYNGRIRWSLISGVRAASNTHFYEYSGSYKKEDISSELKKDRLRINSQCVETLLGCEAPKRSL